MESNFILWLTGVDDMLAETFQVYTWEDSNELYDKVGAQIKQRFAEEGYRIEEYSRGRFIIYGHNQPSVAFITGLYTPQAMLEDIEKYEFNRIIFIRPQKAKDIDKYIAVGAAYNYSFFEQHLPTPKFFATGLGKISLAARDRLAALLTGKNRNNKKDGQNQNLILGRQKQSVSSKEIWYYVLKLLYEFIKAVNSNCAFFQSIGQIF